MMKRGEIYENPVARTRATIRLGTADTDGQRLVADLEVRKCGAGPALHRHPTMHERLTVLCGRVALSVNGKTSIAEVGCPVEIPPGVPHRWWNAGIYEAKVTIEVEPAARYEEYFRNLLGLAQDGKTNAMGEPHFLQRAVLAYEFADVIQFEKPSKYVPAGLFKAIAPMGKLFGYRGSYSQYLHRPPSAVLGPEAMKAERFRSALADSA
jgi:quercetin dioxygenase-like cupin family protein